MANSELSALPGVDALLNQSSELVERYGRSVVTSEIRLQLERIRTQYLDEKISKLPPATDIIENVSAGLNAKFDASLQVVQNLTGTILHTNIGRARLPDTAIAAMSKIGAEYSNLEFNLTTGKRGDRDDHLEALIQEITGAEAATVVNNNAAAVLLTLSALAARKEVPVSRGELVEIGGSFRIPEVMTQSGCVLHEVGATNRTHAKDYEAAINDQTALLMKVHTSNYEINGFTHSVSEKEVAEIAKAHGLPLVSDLGSGSLVDLRQWNLPYENTVQDALKDGADIVTFSGDKLLGGPQCGLIVGRADLIKKIKAHPLKRALRVDKVTIAAVTEVLKLYLDPDKLMAELPTLRDLIRPIDTLQEIAERVAQHVTLPGFELTTIATQSQIGSGALPTRTIDSVAVCLTASDGKDTTLQSLEVALRTLNPPILGRISDGKLLLDVRTLHDPDPLIDQLNALPR